MRIKKFFWLFTVPLTMMRVIAVLSLIFNKSDAKIVLAILMLFESFLYLASELRRQELMLMLTFRYSNIVNKLKEMYSIPEWTIAKVIDEELADIETKKQ